MFVVKRPFKNFGTVYTTGSVITEPEGIKRFKGKLAEGKIIEVTEQTYNDTAQYFKAKYGVVLPPLASAVTEETDNETKPASNEQEQNTGEVKAEPVKPEQKATNESDQKAPVKAKVSAATK